MARTTPRPWPTTTLRLDPFARTCAQCGTALWAAYYNYRTITTLATVLRLTLQIRRCNNAACAQFARPYRPEDEGGLALPKQEFGLDVLALVGALRATAQQSVTEIHQELVRRRVVIAPRTVAHLLERYATLVTLSLTDRSRFKRLTRPWGRVILALDGLRSDVTHEVLWVMRDCLSTEVLGVCRLVSASQEDFTALLCTVRQAVEVPIVGILSEDGHAIQRAVAAALPGIPHWRRRIPTDLSPERETVR